MARQAEGVEDDAFTVGSVSKLKILGVAMSRDSTWVALSLSAIDENFLKPTPSNA